MTYTVEPVTDRRAFGEFCALPLRLHPADRYVPTPTGVLANWWRGRGPQTRYGPVDFYLVRSAGGTVVGRTCVHRNPRLDAKLGGAHQLFGLTEFVDDDAVVSALVDTIAARAGTAAASAGGGTLPLFGPVALLPNQAGGVITSGFGERGFVDSAWNPAHYPQAYERHGFTRRFEADTWLCELPDSDPDDLFRFDDARLAAERLVIRRGSRRGFAGQLEILRTMLNASFGQLGYYTDIDADELAAQTEGLAYLVDEGLLLWLEKAGRPVAFVVTVPDISAFLARVGGKLGAVNQLRLLATRSRYRREAVLIIKGTIPEEQGRGYLTLLSRELYRNLRAGGYRTLRSTFVERDNPGSAAQYRRMGGRPLHGYAFYSRPAESGRKP